MINVRSRVFPVLEANLFAIGSATSRDYDTENDETDDCQDLDTGKPEFGLAVCAGTENIDKDDDKETDRNPDTVVDSLVPQVDQDGRGRQLGGENDSPVVPVVPSHTESESGIDETSGEPDVAAGNGQERDHFTERNLLVSPGDASLCAIRTLQAETYHYRVADGSHNGVAQEETKRTTIGESRTGTEEKTCTAFLSATHRECVCMVGHGIRQTHITPPILIIAICLDFN